MSKPGKLQIEEFQLDRSKKMIYVAKCVGLLKQPEYFLSSQKLFM